MENCQYLIVVDVEHTSTSDLVAALQSCYDEGAAGSFEVVPMQHHNHAVLFLRTTADDDAEYLRERMRRDGISARIAAQHQLGAELELGNGHETVRHIAATLRQARGKIVTFGNEALDLL